MNKDLAAYQSFLESKVVLAPDEGLNIDPADVSPVLKPHQRDAVIWALKGGRRALFESFGLGKSVQQLEFCRLVQAHYGGKALIVLPLGVKQEFQRDAVQILGYDQVPEYVRTMEEASNAKSPILLTNYERVRDGDIDPTKFVATSLDEAAVLRSFGSKTYQTFLDKFRGVPFKLVATATPSPNKIKELINYAGYLEIMDTGQALTRFFQRNSTKANDLSLYPHKEQEFWLWVASWALFIQTPSDLGYDDTGYSLPEMIVRYHEIEEDITQAGTDRKGQILLFKDAARDLRSAANEKNSSIEQRVAKAAQIIAENPDDHYIIWHDLEAERKEITRQIPNAIEIYGSMDEAEREQRTIDFSDGKSQIFATKKSLSGCGCNFQRHCHRAIFLGIDYKFHDFIQAIHRIYRFLQTEQVVIDVIYMQSEQEILTELKAKWSEYDKLTANMQNIVKTYGLSHNAISKTMERSVGISATSDQGNHYTLYNNDCVAQTAKMDSDSIDLIVTSVPFSNHYEYTASYNDFGHNENTKRFFDQMDFLSPELLRVLRPGRVFACHVKDRVLFGNTTGTGMPTMEPFHAMCIEHYMNHGFQYFGMITILTDVVHENNQTYRLGWTEQCKDGTKMGVGCPEYVLLFRKLPSDTSTAYADVPVTKTKREYTRARWQLDAHGFWRSSGNRILSAAEIKALDISAVQRNYREYSRATIYDYSDHVTCTEDLDAVGRLPAGFMAMPPASWSEDVWDDIARIKTLNSTQSRRNQQMHVCPLQIDVVDRLINRYSNPSEIIYDPFGGIMTVPYRAVMLGRYGIGCELNAGYYADGLTYVREAENKVDAPTLFDFLPDTAEA